MSRQRIHKIHFREILDSRGYPTVACDLWMQDGLKATASVPSGKSTGKYEACELRDGDSKRYQGKGLMHCIARNQKLIQEALFGVSVEDQQRIDQTLMALDGTPNKTNIGANFMLAVSLACARARAVCADVALYRSLDMSRMCGNDNPKLMVNIINGGQHANNALDIQEFMIVPLAPIPLSEHVRIACDIFHKLQDLLSEDGYATAVGDEGGVAPNIASHTKAFDYIMQAIEGAGYKPGEDVGLALDCAASSFFNNGYYHFDNQQLTSAAYIAQLECYIKNYPIISIEDPCDEDDWEGWTLFTQKFAQDMRVVGDDLFVTNTAFLQKGIAHHVANAILIKPNQIGTLSETMQTIRCAQAADYDVVVSHRSGETEDTFIADLAVAVRADYVKFGSVCRSERTAKYNRLMEIYAELQ